MSQEGGRKTDMEVDWKNKHSIRYLPGKEKARLKAGSHG